MEKFEELGLTNQFRSPLAGLEINFRNEDVKRTNVSSIEITKLSLTGDKDLVVFPAKTEDNLAMAIAVLGVGRVTDAVESTAQRRADQILSDPDSDPAYVDAALAIAVINLRAAMIIRERNSAEEKQLTEDAYALYRLAYPKSEKTFEVFECMEMQRHWIANLRKVRQDPTALGAL
jgi:hypothetical protein